MILKQYGTTFQSVVPNFDSKALNEVGFRRDRALSVAVEDFREQYERAAVHELEAEVEGMVQDHTEQELLDRVEAQLTELVEGLGDGQVLVLENGDGHDYPKTRQRTTNVVIQGENRLHFVYSIAPALRVGVYRRKD
ncbi:MAG: hypothetical protein RJQ04_06495 [Longimicrobiales bacterium]